MTSARCTRHSPRYGTRSGCASHHRVSASVHSRGASDVEQVRARREHAAVDDAGDDRRELAGGGGDHGFVEQRDAALYLAALDEHAAMALPRQAGEVRVAEPLADRCGFGECVSRLLDVSTHDRVAGLGNQQVAALHAWVAALVEQTCGARQPAGSLRGVAAVHQNRRDARCDAAGATEIPLLNESLVRSYQGRQAVVVFADKVRGRRQFDQLRRGERRLPIALAQDARRSPSGQPSSFCTRPRSTIVVPAPTAAAAPRHRVICFVESGAASDLRNAPVLRGLTDSPGRRSSTQQILHGLSRNAGPAEQLRNSSSAASHLSDHSQAPTPASFRAFTVLSPAVYNLSMNDMTRLVNPAWWLVLRSAACTALVLAAACGGSDQARTQTATQSSTQAQQPAAAVTEKPFAAGGSIEMQLGGGSYTIRPARDSVIRVTLGGNAGTTRVDVSTTDTHAKVLVQETPRKKTSRRPSRSRRPPTWSSALPPVI